MWVIRLVVSCLLAAAAPAAELTFDPAASLVTFTVPTTLHTVHGSFQLKRGVVRYDAASGEASGEVVVDVASGETGNGSRDKRMRSVVLESTKFAEAVFRVERVEGQSVRGTLTLHGTDHTLTVPMQVSTAGGKTVATGSFDVPYTAWGMKDASQLILRVTPVVRVEMKLVATTP